MTSGVGCLEWFRQCLLVAVTIGLEASVTLEVIFMIANIQTLGVPIRYSSLPGTVSAAMGVVLIPTMGFVMDRWAKSKSGKAKIMIGTCSLQILGNLLIFSANVIKLVNFDYDEGDNASTASPWLSTTQGHNSTTVNASSHTRFSDPATALASFDNSSAVSSRLDASGPTESNFLRPDFQNNAGVPATIEEAPVRYFAILGMIGYALLDCGYDSSNCFLKTFALASTAPRHHSGIIAKAVFVSSFGTYQ